MIFGDSYSTFRGYIPAEYDTYYRKEGIPETDVNLVEQTWWYQLLKKTNSELVMNNSYSGTTICNTGYIGQDVSNSFIRRFDKLAEERFFDENPIDTVLVMGGQNDDWCNAPIGELKAQDWTGEDLLQYGPAVCYLMHRLKSVLPKTRIIFIINSEMKEVIMDYQLQAAEIFKVESIRLESIHKMNGHPTIRGMSQITEQIFSYLEDRVYL